MLKTSNSTKTAKKRLARRLCGRVNSSKANNTPWAAPRDVTHDRHTGKSFHHGGEKIGGTVGGPIGEHHDFGGKGLAGRGQEGFVGLGEVPWPGTVFVDGGVDVPPLISQPFCQPEGI